MSAPKPNTPDPLRYKLAQEEGPRREAEQRAAATPMPGALRDAFAIKPSVRVGPYTVRPLYDLDVEILQQLKHPLLDIVLCGIAGKKAETVARWVPRGEHAWASAWIFTHEPGEVEASLLDGTFSAKAKKEFSLLQIGGLLALHEAIMQQIEGYFDTVQAYEPEPVEGSSPPQRPQS